ncbi:hypothetical protein GCM10023203_29670 [Actinomycetospora straminea]|uniref:Uncharacterized protein n=1 Tax=Actinomycetospora straminea TaxID=663607 RepID=A0ABP9EHV8_9PSEU
MPGGGGAKVTPAASHALRDSLAPDSPARVSERGAGRWGSEGHPRCPHALRDSLAPNSPARVGSAVPGDGGAKVTPAASHALRDSLAPNSRAPARLNGAGAPTRPRTHDGGGASPDAPPPSS